MAPNIVLFLTDQLRRDALGCYGNEICQTPNLDQLSSQGVCFDQAYTTSPVCSPARASLMTGQYPHNHGVMINTHIAPTWTRGLAPEVPTFSRLLKEAGYALDYVGKWHVHEDLGPEAFGFDRHIETRARQEIAPGSELVIDFPGGRVPVAATSALSKEEHKTWRVTEDGIGLLRERAEGDQPFFLRIDATAPHFANIVPESFASMYDPQTIPPWPNFAETFAGKPSAHWRKHQEWHLDDKDWRWWQEVVAKYYGDISLIDACVGRVLEAIVDCGIEDETIFIFSTDHGDAMGSHKHFEKSGTMYDEIFRIPLLVRMPGGEPRTVAEFVRLMDLMPTFVEWGGGVLPEAMDARSLVPLLRGEKPAEWPDSVYCESHGEVWGYNSQRMVRTARWKYVYSPNDIDELYDLEKDSAEMENRIDDPSCTDILAEMKGRLIGWNDATDDMFQWQWVRWNFPDPIVP